MKILVNSIPKSGTYLLGKLLDSLGYDGGVIHFRDTHYWDWSKAGSLSEYHLNPNKYRVNTSFNASYSVFEEGYAYAHLNCTSTSVEKLSDLNAHLFLTRELRVATVSFYRFGFENKKTTQGRGGGPTHFPTGWKVVGEISF